MNKENQKILCQCKESIYEGLPCRHELALIIHVLKDSQLFPFELRWKQNYYHDKYGKKRGKESEEKENNNDEDS